MPVTYAKLPFRLPAGPGTQARHAALHANSVLLRRYRGSVAAGVVLCFALNVVWCVCVLQIVPQTSGSSRLPPALDKLEVSLEEAAEHGQVSTVPLVTVVEADPRTEGFRWVSQCVAVFIVISVSVSFMTLGTGLKHVLDGFAYSRTAASSPDHGKVPLKDLIKGSVELVGQEEVADAKTSSPAGGGNGVAEEQDGAEGSLQRRGADAQELDPPLPCGCRLCIRTVPRFRALLYSLSFGLVLSLALANPEGFIVFIEVFGSFALNLECGVFISVMAWNAQTSPRFADLPIPLRAARAAQFGLIGFTAFLFSAACTYDVWSSGAAALGWGPWLAVVVGSTSAGAAVGLVWVCVRRSAGAREQRHDQLKEVT